MTDSPLEKKPAPRAAEADVRASDADRDRIADILRDALAEGRLDAGEHSERLDALYKAKTMGELVPIVRDLPAARSGSAEPAPRSSASYGWAPAPDQQADNVVAIFSGATRKGRWRVSGKINTFALFGGIDIDLTEAVFEHREIVINATAIFGGVSIRVPENVHLQDRGTGIFGGFDIKANEAAEPDAPRVLVQGAAIFGGVDAKPKRGKRLKNLRKDDWGPGGHGGHGGLGHGGH